MSRANLELFSLRRQMQSDVDKCQEHRPDVSEKAFPLALASDAA